MKHILLNGEKMSTKETAHDYLAFKLDFPPYYGKNLDALWDLLSAAGEPLEINLINVDCLRANLGDYADLLLAVLAEAGKANENVSFHTGAAGNIVFSKEEDNAGI